MNILALPECFRFVYFAILPIYYCYRQRYVWGRCQPGVSSMHSSFRLPDNRLAWILQGGMVPTRTDARWTQCVHLFMKCSYDVTDRTLVVQSTTSAYKNPVSLATFFIPPSHLDHHLLSTFLFSSANTFIYIVDDTTQSSLAHKWSRHRRMYMLCSLRAMFNSPLAQNIPASRSIYSCITW